jgi:large subunit ribosomal protein L23
MNLHDVIVRPLITEKATDLQAQDKYAFQVSRAANKLQVKEAVEKAFNVHVTDVNVITVPGRMKRRGRRMVATTAWKKAVVSIKPGENIAYFEGV